MVYLQGKNCVIHTWALQTALYKSFYLYLYLQDVDIYEMVNVEYNGLGFPNVWKPTYQFSTITVSFMHKAPDVRLASHFCASCESTLTTCDPESHDIYLQFVIRCDDVRATTEASNLGLWNVLLCYYLWKVVIFCCAIFSPYFTVIFDELHVLHGDCKNSLQLFISHQWLRLFSAFHTWLERYLDRFLCILFIFQ